MTISTIRRATKEDEQAVKKAAERFCRRHNISFGSDEYDTAESSINYETHDNKILARAWQRVYCRALGEPYNRRLTIGYGYVGLIVG